MTQGDLFASLRCAEGWHGPILESDPFLMDGSPTVRLTCAGCGFLIAWSRQFTVAA